jgi:hypothetical protein
VSNTLSVAALSASLHFLVSHAEAVSILREAAIKTTCGSKGWNKLVGAGRYLKR